METVIPGGGLLGGLIVGVPLIALRRPILRIFSNLSSTLMPEAHTTQKLQYLEVFAAANADGIINTKERTMLDVQAKAFGVNEARQSYLEGLRSAENPYIKRADFAPNLFVTSGNDWL